MKVVLNQERKDARVDRIVWKGRRGLSLNQERKDKKMSRMFRLEPLF